MGNCMERCRERRDEEGEEEYQEKQRNVDQEEKKGSSTGPGGGYGVRVKIMLTKEELEWMMFQLKENGSAKGKKKKSLEDLLREIETARSSTAPAWKIEAWRPSLESIMETPELILDMDR